MNNLIQKLKEYALLVNKNKAIKEAKMLNEYALKLSNTALSGDTLKEFYEFTWHYKGMRDMIVPNYSEKEWTAITKELEKSSKQAMIEQGFLKKGIITTLLDFFRSYKNEEMR